MQKIKTLFFFCFTIDSIHQKLKIKRSNNIQLDLVRIPETKKDSLFCARTHLKEKYIYKCHTAKKKQYSWCHHQTILDLSVKKWRAPDSFFFSIINVLKVHYYKPKPRQQEDLILLYCFHILFRNRNKNRPMVFVFSLFMITYFMCRKIVYFWISAW